MCAQRLCGIQNHRKEIHLLICHKNEIDPNSIGAKFQKSELGEHAELRANGDDFVLG